MKKISPSLQEHLNGELTTLAELVKITREDGVVLAFTTHDVDIDYNGVRYLADGSYEANEVKQDDSLKENDCSIIGHLGSPLIKKLDLESGIYDHARIEVAVCNWKDLSQGVVQLRRGWLGEVVFSDGQYIASLRGFRDLLSRRIGETYTPECRYDLGGARCGVDLAALGVSGNVTSVTDKASFSDSARTEENGHFADAKLSWMSGLNSGTSVEVNGWDLSYKRFQLWLPMAHEIQVGDTYMIACGCDKRFSTCKTRFDNVVNYGGFPHLPGLGKLLFYPD